MSVFPTRWPPTSPDHIQLYSLATPNGQKAAIALEELGLPYDAHRIDIGKGDQRDPEFVKINPNSKIPALLDPHGPGDAPLMIMESGAILHYLAKKTGKLIPARPSGESEALQWLFFQVGSVGPMFGQLGHFKVYAPKDADVSYSVKRYGTEVERLLKVLDDRLDGREWLIDEYSVADIATAPWVLGLDYYKTTGAQHYSSYANVAAWLARFDARPAVQRGKKVTPF